MPHLSNRTWIGLAVAAVLLAAAGVTVAGAQGDDTPRGTDPLSEAEEEVARSLARGSGVTESSGGGLGDDDVILLVERHEEEKTADDSLRRADVYVYSYDDDVLTLTIVDTATGEVDASTVLRDTQLPLTPDEGARALEIALAAPGFEEALATAFRQSAGRDLVDPLTELDIQPIVFRADANPDSPRSVAQCGRHRCAQLLIETPDSILVNLLPIVDLSAGRLASTTGFFS